MTKRDYALPWKRGTGNDCHKIWDANGRLVATLETCADSTFLVESVNRAQEYRAIAADALADLGDTEEEVAERLR